MLNLSTNKSRLEHRIKEFAKIGKTKANGVSRLALSKNDIEARNYFSNICKSLNIGLEIDDLGNMYAILKSDANKNRKPIIIGSHLDTVENGGKFDGSLGIIAGVEVMETIINNDILMNHPLIIANFTNEEGVRFSPSVMSSGILAGYFDKNKMLQQKDINGISFEDALKQSGYEGSIKNRINKGKAFIELHIEQGPILENNNKSIGIVNGVKGMMNFTISTFGSSNHAGTTPMNLRNDALQNAIVLINYINQQLGIIDEKLVYTIGSFHVHPNLHTVIPNKVDFSFEIRHDKPDKLNQIYDLITSLPNKFTFPIEINKNWKRPVVHFDDMIIKHITESVKAYNMSYEILMSGAGHDAQFISKIIPTAMIFVPSKDGISHSPDEYSSINDCYNGANILLQSILNIDKEIGV